MALRLISILSSEYRTLTEGALTYGETGGETLTMDYYAPKAQGVRCDIIRIPGEMHGTGHWHTLTNVPDWEREMIE
ncbi:MAG: hypothetical protein M3Y72_23360 [Acidobacteriota bacterium]|nr:hypothetical protein [Acidobacteriota bacterium]